MINRKFSKVVKILYERQKKKHYGAQMSHSHEIPTGHRIFLLPRARISPSSTLFFQNFFSRDVTKKKFYKGKFILVIFKENN